MADYLAGLPPAQAAELARVNGPGLAALRGYLASGEAVAFLGAGVSAPLYPLWDGLIGELADAAAPRLDEREVAALPGHGAAEPGGGRGDRPPAARRGELPGSPAAGAAGPRR